MPADNQLNVRIVVDANQLTSGMQAATATVTSASQQMAAALSEISPASKSMAASLKNAGMSAADASSAMKNLGFSAKETSDALAQVDLALEETGPAAERAATGVNNARAAMMGLNRELGLGGNRALSTFIAQSETIGPILSKAFTGIAIVGFIQLAILAAEKISAITTELYGFSAAAKALYDQQLKTNQNIQRLNEEHKRQLRDIEVLGKPLAEQERMRAQWAKEDAQGLAATIAQKNRELAIEEQLLEKKRAAREMIAKDPQAQSFSLGGLDKDIKAQEEKIQDLNRALGELQREYVNAGTAAEGMSKKAGIEATKEAEKAAKEQERLEKQKEEATHRRIIAELNDEERLAKERIKIDEFDAQITREFNRNIEQEEKRLDTQILANKKSVLQEIVKEQEKWLKTQERLAKEAAKPWRDMFRSITTGMDSMIKGILQGTQSMGQAFSRLGADLLVIMAEAYAKMALKWVENRLLMVAVNTATEGEITAVTAAGTAARGAIEKTHSLAGIVRAASHAAAKAFHEVPFPVNLVVAPAIFAAAMAFGAGLPSAAGGWDMVPSGGALTMLHAREMVLSAPIADAVRAGAGAGGSSAGGKGDTHIHVTYSPQISAIDARGISGMLDKHSGDIATAVRKEMRRLNSL
jgi:hypothetical protein